MLLLLLLLYTKEQLFSISLKGQPRNMVGTLLVHLLLQGIETVFWFSSSLGVFDKGVQYYNLSLFLSFSFL